MDTKPVVSVLLPVFNGEKYLAEALESMLSQTFNDFEFIIINDGSADGTAGILERYRQRDRRIRVHAQSQHGLVRALNRGLELARGRYIARMDADDVSLPERLGKQVDFLENHPEIGVLGTGIKIMDGSGTPQPWPCFTQHGVLRWCLCFFCAIIHPTVMMRREIVERVGGYSPDMVHAEDYDLWRRLSAVTRLSNLPDVLLHRREHAANISTVHALEQRRNSVRISCLMISHLLNEEVSTDIVQRLWDREFQSASDMRPVAELVYRLYQAIIAKGGLSAMEKQAIRRNAAMRLAGLARSWAPDVSVWGVLAQACYLDPLLVLRVGKRRLRRFFVSKKHGI